MLKNTCKIKRKKTRLIRKNKNKIMNMYMTKVQVIDIINLEELDQYILKAILIKMVKIKKIDNLKI